MHSYIAGLFIALSAVMVNGQGVEMEICSCRNARLAKQPVCGTDNIDYRDVCTMMEAQKSDQSLGRRCLGKCPCDASHLKFSAEQLCGANVPLFGTRAFSPADFRNIKDPSAILDVIGVEHAAYGDDHLKRCIFQHLQYNQPPKPSQDSQNEVSTTDSKAAEKHHNQLHPKFRPAKHQMVEGQFPECAGPVCLTNGTTVSHMKIAMCEVRKSIDMKGELGVRCLGPCEVCGKHTGCASPNGIKLTPAS